MFVVPPLAGLGKMAGVARRRGYSSGSCSAASVACAAFIFSGSGLYVLRCVRNHACVILYLKEIPRYLIARKKTKQSYLAQISLCARKVGIISFKRTFTRE